MKVGRMITSVGGLTLAAAALHQHRTDLDQRRTRAQDRQPLWYHPETFHVVTFLQCDPASDPVAAVRALHRATRRFRDVMWVYAGRVVLTTAVSRQIGPVDWDAVVVHQFPSATDHRMVARSLAYQEALSAFPRSYAHGFRRWRTVNVLAPQVIGLRRAMRRIRREPDLLPFRPRACGHDDADLGRSGSLDKLLTEPLDTEGAVAFSLLAGGEGDHRGAGCRTAMSMLELMAEARFGPTHLGPAVAVEGDARFDAVAAVCYPSLEFVADMAGSEFFRRMAAGNQMDDLHSVVTVPILHRL